MRIGPAAIGWALVGVQVVCFAGLVATSGRADWPTPWWVEAVGWTAIAVAVVLGLAAARSLGSALTATPEPKPTDRLRTDGAYRWVRHPIYSAVLLAIAGWVLRSGSLATLAIGIATALFFDLKSRWEERRLAARYPEYPDYAHRTGRFVPRRSPGV